MTIPLITYAPARSQDQTTFDINVEGFITQVIDAIPAMNTDIATTNTNATTATTGANTATTKAAEAAASAQSANGAAGAAKWVSGTTYAEGTVVWSPTNFLSYRRKVAGAGTTDPVNDTTNWVQIQTDYNNGINPTAIAQSINMTEASSGSNGIQVADNANIDFGTGNFTLHWEGSLPDWTPGTNQYLCIKQESVTKYYTMLIFDSGRPVIRIARDTTEVAYPATTNTGAAEGNVQKITACVERETASSDGYITFYTNGVQLGSVVTIPFVTTTNAGASIDNTGNLYILGTSATRYAGRAKSAILYNRALSASEVLDLCRNGVAYADTGASQIPQYVGDFSAGTDNWVSYSNCTIAGNTDGIAGENDWLAINATGLNPAFRRLSTSQPCITPYKRARIKLRYYAASGSATNIRITNQVITGSEVFGEYAVVYGSVQEVVFDVTEGLGYYGMLVQFLGGVNTDSYYMKDFISYPSGATLELTPEGIQPEPGQWLDSSGNKQHAKMPIEGATTTRRKKDFEVRWSNTWAGTQEAQYLGGVNEAILPSDNIRNESITMRCSATGVNVILGDGSNTSRWVASVALATYLDATVANRNHDGTNRKLVIKPSANYAGTITTTIIGRILD